MQGVLGLPQRAAGSLGCRAGGHPGAAVVCLCPLYLHAILPNHCLMVNAKPANFIILSLEECVFLRALGFVSMMVRLLSEDQICIEGVFVS